MLVINYIKQSRQNFLPSWGIYSNYSNNLILLGLFHLIINIYLYYTWASGTSCLGKHGVAVLELRFRWPGFSFWGFHLVGGWGSSTLTGNTSILTTNRQTAPPARSHLTLLLEDIMNSVWKHLFTSKELHVFAMWPPQFLVLSLWYASLFPPLSFSFIFLLSHLVPGKNTEVPRSGYTYSVLDLVFMDMHLHLKCYRNRNVNSVSSRMVFGKCNLLTVMHSASSKKPKKPRFT